MNIISIPYTNRIHNFPNTGWPLYPLSFQEFHEAQSQLLGALILASFYCIMHNERISDVEGVPILWS